MISMQTLRDDDWSRWRSMRLAALSEAPYAFGSTLADWTGTGDTEERWRQRLLAVPFNVLALLDCEPVGMASATAPVSGEVELISMWVSPAARGRGVGEALLETVVAWAAARGASTVALDVGQNNHHAVALYARNGFVDVGWASETGDSGQERRMVRQLA